MAADDGDGDVLHGHARDLVHELLRADAVQRRDADDLLRVQALLLPELAHGRHDGVDGVDDEGHNGVGAELRARLDDVLGDASVDGDEVLTVLAGIL